MGEQGKHDFSGDFSNTGDDIPFANDEQPPTLSPELSGLRMLVRKSANQIAKVLPHEVETGIFAGYALGYTASALASSESNVVAHDYAQRTVSQTDMDVDDAFHVWKELYKAGDGSALPLARRAAGLAGEQVSFLERIGVVELGGLHSAERLVSLVEAGDTSTVEVARGITKNVPSTEKAALFAKLYAVGDEESYELAIKAAQEAKGYTDRTGDSHYWRSDQALAQMATVAAANGKNDEALILISKVEDQLAVAKLHVDLFAAGREESLETALDILDAVESNWSKRAIERMLASSGYAPAVNDIRKRLTFVNIRASGTALIDSPLGDLEALHKSGDERASKRAAKLILSNANPQDYTGNMLRLGLKREALSVAQRQYEVDPTPRNEAKLLDLEYNESRWQRVFEHTLFQEKNVLSASGYMLQLAYQAKLENNL